MAYADKKIKDRKRTAEELDERGIKRIVEGV
jgi:hypothetical protein